MFGRRGTTGSREPILNRLRLALLLLASSALAADSGNARHDHWAFRALERPLLPSLKDTVWPRAAVDQFILARLEAAGLEIEHRVPFGMCLEHDEPNLEMLCAPHNRLQAGLELELAISGARLEPCKSRGA